MAQQEAIRRVAGFACGWLLVWSLSLAPSSAFADQSALASGNPRTAPGPGFEPDAIELDARIAALDAYLYKLQRPTRAHYHTWIALLSAVGATQVVLLALADDRRERTNYGVGAALSVIGVASVLFLPRGGLRATQAFRALPGRTFEEKRAKLAQGEGWLEAEAKSVRFTRSWVPHAGAAVVGLGAGLALGLAFANNWLAAMRVGVGAMFITQVRVWTRPKQALRYLERYQRHPTQVPALSCLPWLGRHATGLSLRLVL